MILKNTALYAPEQEGGSGPISSSEISGQELEALTQTPEDIGDAELGPGVVEEIQAPDEEVSSAELLRKALQEFEQQEIENNQLPFKIDPETGLSLEGKEMQKIQNRIAILESRQAKDIEDLVNTEARIVQQEGLQSALDKAKTNQDNLLQQIQQEWNGFKARNPDTKKTQEDFLTKLIPDTETTPQGMINAEEEKVKAAQIALTEFETETKRLINEVYETELQAARDQLEALESKYKDTLAEKNDKKVLLEQKLESSLTKPEELLSDAHIAEILAVYGLQEGKERIQQLQEQSKEAQEKETKDTIKIKILKNIYWSYKEIPELAQAMSDDIGVKLQQLLEANPESDTIQKALKWSGVDRIEYLSNSGDPALEQLVFWYSLREDKEWLPILDEHPKVAQYLEKTVNTQWEEQNQQKDDFKMQREQRIQEGINARIEDGVSRYQKQEVNRIKGEISTIQNDEVFYSQDRKDRSIVQSKEAIRLTNMNEFKASIQSGVEGITINEGRFITQNDIAEANKKIDEEMATLRTNIQGYLTEMGYDEDKVRALDLDKLDTLETEIQTDLIAEDQKIWKNRKKIDQLTKLKKSISEDNTKYKTLKNQKVENQKIVRQRLERVNELNTMVGRLPQYIKETLMASSINNMSERFDALIQELQQYETPAELQAQRDKIDQLKRQIEELQRVM